MATVLSIAPLPPSPRPLQHQHPSDPLTPPSSTSPIFKFTPVISTRSTTPNSIHSALDTPPASPSDDTSSIESLESSQTLPSEPSLTHPLFPPDQHQPICREKGTIYSISASTLAKAYHHVQTTSLPPASDLFPWAHGLNPRNAGQLCFFNANSHISRSPPINIGYRGLTIIHVPAPFGCYRPGRLIGAVNHTEILGRSTRDGHFVDPDPMKGICLRNFHIQTAKWALLSDIVVYSPRGGQSKEVLDVAERISQAQRLVRMKFSTNQHGIAPYNTFVVTDDMETFENNHPELVAIDSCGRTTEHKIEFLSQEREEMRRLTTATKISRNVYLGNSADAFNSIIEYTTSDGKTCTKGFDVCIEAKDMAEVASAATLREAETFLNGEGIAETPVTKMGAWYTRSLTRPLALEFPSSTPPVITRHDPDAIVAFCEWIYQMTHPSQDAMTDIDSIDENTRSILIHCQDGYTESTFLALAYLMFAEGITAHEAWIKLHVTLGRSFFAFESDLQALKYLQSYLLQKSPTTSSVERLSTPMVPPAWFTHVAFDGSFPSRILPHMYLGNLQHANNPEMLRALGITRVLSIGEQVVWDHDKETAAGMKLLHLDNVQDNGIDPLLDYIDHCLEFLDAGFTAKEKTLVHCRVGVSRSASICIAEVIRRMHLSLPRAYLYVRARRLNVIIQPNLRFMYELMKWEELEFARNLQNNLETEEQREYKREMEWAWLCKEIADLNKTYTAATS